MVDIQLPDTNDPSHDQSPMTGMNRKMVVWKKVRKKTTRTGRIGKKLPVEVSPEGKEAGPGWCSQCCQRIHKPVRQAMEDIPSRQKG